MFSAVIDALQRVAVVAVDLYIVPSLMMVVVVVVVVVRRASTISPLHSSQCSLINWII